MTRFSEQSSLSGAISCLLNPAWIASGPHPATDDGCYTSPMPCFGASERHYELAHEGKLKDEMENCAETAQYTVKP